MVVQNSFYVVIKIKCQNFRINLSIYGPLTTTTISFSLYVYSYEQRQIFGYTQKLTVHNEIYTLGHTNTKRTFALVKQAKTPHSFNAQIYCTHRGFGGRVGSWDLLGPGVALVR